MSPAGCEALVEQPGRADPGRLDGHHRLVGRCPGGGAALELAAIDLATGQRRMLLARGDADFVAPVVAPDGRSVVCGAEVHGTLDEAPRRRLWLRPARPDPAARAAHRV